MTSFSIGLISTACIFGGVILGLILRRVLPVHHLDSESKESMKAGAGTIATLAALVLGLLVASAKSSFDNVSAGLTQTGAKIILLDRVLARYGPEAKPAREQLRLSVQDRINALWPELGLGATPQGVTGMAAVERQNPNEAMAATLQQLKPQDDAQRAALAQAMQIVSDLQANRWLLIEEADSALQTPFLVVLLFWITLLFTSFGLFAPRNATVISVLLLCALSMSGAIYLVLEMNHPLDGMIKVSARPLVTALEHLGQP